MSWWEWLLAVLGGWLASGVAFALLFAAILARRGPVVKARDRGTKRPCEICSTQTMFMFEVRGPRGARLRWADICPACGEQPEKTRGLK